MSQIEEEEKLAENKRKEVAASEIEEKRKKLLEKESFLNDLEKGDRPLDEIVSEHSSKMTKKQSVLFSSVKVHIQAYELTSLRSLTNYIYINSHIMISL